jgi:hypothetical protein
LQHRRRLPRGRDPEIAEHRGRIVKATSANLLVEFVSRATRGRACDRVIWLAEAYIRIERALFRFIKAPASLWAAIHAAPRLRTWLAAAVRVIPRVVAAGYG